MEEGITNLGRNIKKLDIDNTNQSGSSTITHQKELVPIMQSENGNQAELNNDPEIPRIPIAKRLCRLLFRLCCCCCFSRRVHSSDTFVYPTTLRSGKKTLVLDLDETLVHSSLESVNKYDLKVPIKFREGIIEIYVMLRPGAKDFLEKIGKLYEVIIFTASLESYANPVIDYLDTTKVVKRRLFRDDCVNHNGNLVKNLSNLGRDLKKVIIVDNSPVCYSLHPENAIAINSWFDDENDNQLEDVLKILEILEPMDDVRPLIKALVQKKLDVSPENITLLINRSLLNSPI